MKELVCHLFLTWCCPVVLLASQAVAAEPLADHADGAAMRGQRRFTDPSPSGGIELTPPRRTPIPEMFQNTQLPYTRTVGLPYTRGDSVTTQTRVGLPTVNLRLPLGQGGFDPQDADLAFGPLAFKLREFTAATLWSDNVNLSENNRESGVIAIMSMSGALMARFNDRLRLAVAGSLVYLPLQNEVGITSGTAFNAPFIFGLEGNPNFRSQVVWDTIMGGWNVVFADDFRIDVGSYSDSYRSDVAFRANNGFDGVDRAGRYSFGARGRRTNRNGDLEFSGFDRGNNRGTDRDIVYFSNIISAQTNRLIVGKTRLGISASHENLWYNQGNRGLPRMRDQASVSLVSERENLRFKPFVIYNASRTDTRRDFEQSLSAGINGPITEHMNLHADVGYFFGNARSGLLWGLGLQHQAGPYTEHSLYYRRTQSDFADEISESFGYNIRQIVGPKVVAEAFVSHGDVQALRADGFSRTVDQTGMRISINAGPRTQINLSGVATKVHSGDGDYRLLSGLLGVNHHFTDTFLARLNYQYQQRDSDFRGDSYYENLIYFGLSKYFN